MTPQNVSEPVLDGKHAVRIDAVKVPPTRLRQLQPEAVDVLAESIKWRGQLSPIILRENYTLVVGLHRLEAMKKLGRETIQAEVRRLTDDQALLVELDENLCRAELSPAERALHVARRKEIYERAHPGTKRGKAPGKAGGGKKAKSAKLATFAADTAQKTGQSRRAIARDAARGKDVVVLAEITGTSLDTGVELDALAKLPPDEQRELAARAKGGEKVSAKRQDVKSLLSARNDKKKSNPEPREAGVEDDIEDPENYRTAYLLRVDQAIQFAVYSGSITEDIVAAARRVASKWNALADQLVPKKKSRGDAMPTEREESHQETLYDQACLLLERMADETRQKFFAQASLEVRGADLKNEVHNLQSKIIGLESQISELNSEVAKLNTLLHEAATFIAAGYRSNGGDESEMKKAMSPGLFARAKPELAAQPSETDDGLDIPASLRRASPEKLH